MAHFKFKGSDSFPQDDCTFYGFQFERGEVTDVENEYVADKLRKHFTEAFEEVGAPSEPKRRPGRPRLTDEAKAARAAEKEARVEKAPIQTDLGPGDAWEEGNA
jgi:hypothetical protein